MKVILLQDVKNIGKKSQVINVPDGFAQNHLIPKKLAVEADSAKAKQITNKIKKGEEKLLSEEEQIGQELRKLEKNDGIKITKTGNKEGHFYAKINESDIKKSLISFLKKDLPSFIKIKLDKEIKEVGVFYFTIETKNSKYKIKLVAELDNN